jgi:hypothetical protein
VAEFLHEAADISKEVQAGSGKLLKDFVVALADAQFQGSREQAGARLLRDFQHGRLGPVALELPRDAAARRRDAAAAGGM